MEEKTKTHNEVAFSRTKEFLEITCKELEDQLKTLQKRPIEHINNYTDLFIYQAKTNIPNSYFEVQDYKNFSAKGRLGLTGLSYYECVRDFRILNYIDAKITEVRLYLRKSVSTQENDEFVLIASTVPKEDGSFSFFGNGLWDQSKFSIQIVGECDCFETISLSFKGILCFPPNRSKKLVF